MRITGYKPMTEKERDYLLIHGLLQKYGIPNVSIYKLLDPLKGNLDPVGAELINLHVLLLNYALPTSFCIIDDDSSTHTIILNKLPEGTIELLIET